MKLPTQTEFIDYIQNYLDKTGERSSMLGRRALGDSGAITRIFKGTDPRLSTMNRIIKAMKDKN
jgi:predicted transcriptional regulator